MSNRDVALFVVLSVASGMSVGVAIGNRLGYTAGRQSVEAVACEPTVVGLRKNGKEIPLTSAQRDSLARRP